MKQHGKNSGSYFKNVNNILNSNYFAKQLAIREVINKSMLPYKVTSDFLSFYKNFMPIVPKISQDYARIAKVAAKYINELESSYKEYLKSLDENYQKLIPISEELSKLGWVISPAFSFGSANSLTDIESSELDQYMVKYYTENNYYNFFEEYDDLLSTFCKEKSDKGYFNQLKSMRDMVKTNFSYSVNLIPTAVSILDYKYIEITGKLNTSNYLNKDAVETRLNDLNNDKNNQKIFNFLVKKSILKTLIKFMASTKFKVGVNNTELTRHSIQHGRYNPDRYKNTDFIKIILMIYALNFLTE